MLPNDDINISVQLSRSHNLVTFIRVDTQDYASAHVKMQDASLLTVVGKPER